MKGTRTIKVTSISIGLYALMLVGLAATSARLATAADVHVSGTVGTIVVDPNGSFFFHLEGYPLLCNTTPTGDGLSWITVTLAYATPDGKKELLTVLTSAKLSGRSVQVRGLNNLTSGEWGCRLEALDFL